MFDFRCPSSWGKINSNLRYHSSSAASHVWVLTTPLCFGETAPGTRDVEKVNEIQHQEEPQPGLAQTVFHQTKSSIEECPGNSRF